MVMSVHFLVALLFLVVPSYQFIPSGKYVPSCITHSRLTLYDTLTVVGGHDMQNTSRQYCTVGLSCPFPSDKHTTNATQE